MHFLIAMPLFFLSKGDVFQWLGEVQDGNKEQENN